MIPLLCLASILLFGYILGFTARQTDWDAQSEFRINVFERCCKAEMAVEHLTQQLADYEHRLQCEHELRRELKAEVEYLKRWALIVDQDTGRVGINRKIT